ncbi:hypothetical protein HSBAA_48070 [Vreelandella sulfidaeris]|uniref:Uncharacterized protein n=1 Tax=Vreelandella sulfidaeris TaxID=115553 RepID=A0A455UFP6_9GAMM|nr:hypothetical protein HSBAA_48070 [Halomonas sulfidaeris]
MASPSEKVPMNELVVSALDAIADGIYRVELADPEGNDLPEFTPGAHVRLETPAAKCDTTRCAMIPTSRLGMSLRSSARKKAPADRRALLTKPGWAIVSRYRRRTTTSN